MKLPTGKLKELTKQEQLDQAMKAYKWWEHPDLPEGQTWKTLEHNALCFPPEYKPHGIPLYHKGAPVTDLSPECEELATFYALCPEDGPQLGSAETRPVFRKNFFEDFRKALGKDHAIKKFDDLDFSRIREHIAKEKLIKKAATVDEKATAKEEKMAIQGKYGYALVDGHLEKVGNTMAEPPSLFRGRGKHPLMGKVKQRIMPEQVSINIGQRAKVPICPQPGHAWGRVQHDNSVTWLASWNENILGNNKYVMLAAQSSFKGKSDRDKYGKAMRLKGAIEKIRSDYRKNLSSKDIFNKQLATAMWVIDILALRVGGEKGEDEADTVGCCSLRVEHLNFEGGGDYDIELEFLGKDSMLYKQTTDFDKYGDVGRKVYDNFVSFCKKKKPDQQVLDKLDPPELNRHLSALMPGLTAKVFRTYNASETLQRELPQEAELEGLTFAQKVLKYNEANKKVAILCNHQKTVSKAQEDGLAALADRLEVLKTQKKELGQVLKALKENKPDAIKLKSDKAEKKVAAAKAAIERAKDMTEKAKTPEDKIKATNAMQDAKEMQKAGRALVSRESHLYSSKPNAESVKKRIGTWADKIKKLELDIRNKDDNKEVALGTSKINYCDPRISVAWCKANEVPIERVFPKTLRDKFVWALAVPPEWKFEDPKVKKRLGMPE
jgi:DNA topoisomerase-1